MHASTKILLTIAIGTLAASTSVIPYVGDTIGLHPLVTIVSLLIGGQLFGLSGMLLAVPVTAVLLVFLRSRAGYYRSTPFYRGVL